MHHPYESLDTLMDRFAGQFEAGDGADVLACRVRYFDNIRIVRDHANGRFVGNLGLQPFLVYPCRRDDRIAVECLDQTA